ncbi:hypothetical protein CgunFtcFv8_018479 [Champsocephalus gunnari]|uniref:Ig-like domain-containing protein n=1 Tax=Champsocephalus gunnari TaxID=52237 RepID=A0AAN8GTW8_CHAGU|nr:hypothetical protein CgunFtcFv8_018479 [Champsocephalus gunnari]
MEGTSLYLPIVVLLMQCSPSVPVSVSTDSHKVEAQEFSDAVLSCRFRTEKDQNPRIEWKKKGRGVSLVYYDGHFKAPFEGRASIEGATVTLQRVTQEDAGEYRCEISAPNDSVQLGETNVTLKVLVPPHTPSCEIPSGAVTGSVVQLRCRDQQSIPPATYSWFKNSMPLIAPLRANVTFVINSRTGVLEFKAVAKEDTGRYSCLASNGVGTAQDVRGQAHEDRGCQYLGGGGSGGGGLPGGGGLQLWWTLLASQWLLQPTQRKVQCQLHPSAPRRLQTHPVLHALRSWPSFENTSPS